MSWDLEMLYYYQHFWVLRHIIWLKAQREKRILLSFALDQNEIYTPFVVCIKPHGELGRSGFERELCVTEEKGHSN